MFIPAGATAWLREDAYVCLIIYLIVLATFPLQWIKEAYEMKYTQKIQFK